MATYGFSSLSRNSSRKTIDATPKQQVFTGRVRDIILNEEHPKFKQFGFQGIGIIYWDDVNTPSNPQTSDNYTSYAFPLFQNAKCYPLLNEIVAIIVVLTLHDQCLLI